LLLPLQKKHKVANGNTIVFFFSSTRHCHPKGDEGVTSAASPSCLLLPLQSTSLNAFGVSLRKQEGEAVQGTRASFVFCFFCNGNNKPWFVVALAKHKLPGNAFFCKGKHVLLLQ